MPLEGASSVLIDHATTESNSSSDEEFTPKESHVTVCDINQSMLEVGKSRALEAGIFRGK